MMRVFCDDEGEACFEIPTRSKNREDTTWSTAAISFSLELQDKVLDHSHEEHLPTHTEHKRAGATFCGHPNFQGSGAWKDWALLDWGPGHGILPAQIWCFLVLKNTPQHPLIEHGGIDLVDGTHAVVESSTHLDDEDSVGMCDTFIPLFKDVLAMDNDGEVTERTFYLADVEAFQGTCCVVPDIGGPANAYFQVKPRSEWSEDFIGWLEDTHKKDRIGLGEEDLEEEEEE